MSDVIANKDLEFGACDFEDGTLIFIQKKGHYEKEGLMDDQHANIDSEGLKVGCMMESTYESDIEGETAAEVIVRLKGLGLHHDTDYEKFCTPD